MSGHDGKTTLTSPVNLANRGTKPGEGKKAWTLWLSAIIKFGGSDLIVKSDLKPRIRHRGVLKDVEVDVVTQDLMFQVAKDILDEGQLDGFSKKGSADFAYDYDDKNRFRVNMFMARGKPAVAARLITSNIRKFEELFLPQSLGDIAMSSQGLILFAGVTGSGKSTSIAAMLQYVNERKKVHIVLAYNLRSIVYQKLLPTLHANIARIPALEILINTPAVQKYILEAREGELLDIIKTRDAGMIDYTSALVELVEKEFVHQSVALQSTPKPEELRMRLKGISQGASGANKA